MGRGGGGGVTAKGYSRTKHKQSSCKSRDEEHLLANSDTFIRLNISIYSPNYKPCVLMLPSVHNYNT